MEVLFENKYIRDGEWIQDMMRQNWLRRPVMVAVDVVFALFLLLGIFCSFVVVLEVLVFWLIKFLIYRKFAQLTLDRDWEMHGKPIEVVTSVTNEEVHHKNSMGTEVHLHYTDIKKAIETKKYIYLRTKSNIIYSFKKDSFTVGNAEGLLSFFKEQEYQDKIGKLLKQKCK